MKPPSTPQLPSIVASCGWRSNTWVMKAISLYFVVVGTRNKVVLAGSYQLQTALIIGQRRESTDQKTSLNEALRQFGVSV